MLDTKRSKTRARKRQQKRQGERTQALRLTRLRRRLENVQRPEGLWVVVRDKDGQILDEYWD